MIRWNSLSADARQAGSTIAVSIGVLAMNLAAGIALARGLGVEGRGQVAALVLWATLAMDLAMVGTNASTTYHVARSPSAFAAVVALLKRAVPAMAMVGVLIYSAFIVASDLSAPVRALVVFGAYVPIRILYEQVLATVLGEHRFGLYNRGRLLVAVVPAVGFAVAVFAGIMSVALAGVGYSIALIVGVAGLARSRRERAAQPLCDASPSRFDRASFWSYSFRNWFAVLASKGNSNVDVLILSLLATTSTLGLYAVSISAGSVLTLVGTAAGIVVLPRLAGAEDPHEAAAIYRRLLRVTIAGTGVLAAVVFVSAGFIVPFVFGEGFRGAVPLVRILAIGYVGASIAGFASAVLRGTNRPGTVAIAQIVGMVLTGAVALGIDPSDGVTVATASAIGFWASASIQMVATRQVRAGLLPIDSVVAQHDGF